MLVMLAALEEPRERDFMERLYEENRRLLFATARKYASDDHDAEEIVQDSLVRLMGKVDILQEMKRCTLASYLVSTVRNTAINHLRKQSRQQGRTPGFQKGRRNVWFVIWNFPDFLVHAIHFLFFNYYMIPNPRSEFKSSPGVFRIWMKI